MIRVLLLAVPVLLPATAQQEIAVLDVSRVRATGDPASFIHPVKLHQQASDEVPCGIVVAGAGLGGVAAALRLAERGLHLCLTEETDWIGGQMTAGGVSALDENRFIEFAGGTKSYYEMRRRIRDYYRKHYALSETAKIWENLNPGSCYVSPLCFEPKVGVHVLEEMLAPHRSRVHLMLRTKIVSLKLRGEDWIEEALAYRFDTRKLVRLKASFFLDATELGDLLPLAKVPYIVGSESKADTGEPHAAESPNPACVQSFTYPFALDVRWNENHRIEKPPQYEYFRDHQPFSLKITYPVEYGWRGPFQYKMFGEDPPIPNNMSPGPFFSWRRLLARKNFHGPDAPQDLALINWPRQDYHDESLLDRTALEQARILQQAKRVSLAFLYWLQTELERDDGRGRGYPELRLRADVMDTPDGLSKHPYIRESRRLIPARGRVVEQDIVAEYQNGPRARWFDDSVGVGFYMVDIHPCGANERGRMMMPKPFQIPLQALIPQRVRNLLAAGKNLGVTHLTNGAFRLHPVEWNVGEAAATIAALRKSNGALPAVTEVQKELALAGVPLVWFDDLHPSHPDFAAIQFAAIQSWYPLNREDLHASAESPVTRREAAHALSRFFGVPTTDPVQLALVRGWMASDHRNWFHGDLPFYWTDWREDKFPRPLPPWKMTRTGPVRRAELARRLTGLGLP
ncbi:MAG: FAD-dependent oxidoreductase [Bryobacteraceae bacterium]|nr:FAD-dependent oxidoreductase [Bryobacteraceae bacterium]MDW8376539.1 FAD-dependent oxidoreductase [Bryobacterales bacterium]